MAALDAKQVKRHDTTQKAVKGVGDAVTEVGKDVKTILDIVQPSAEAMSKAVAQVAARDLNARFKKVGMVCEKADKARDAPCRTKSKYDAKLGEAYALTTRFATDFSGDEYTELRSRLADKFAKAAGSAENVARVAAVAEGAAASSS